MVNEGGGFPCFCLSLHMTLITGVLSLLIGYMLVRSKDLSTIDSQTKRPTFVGATMP